MQSKKPARLPVGINNFGKIIRSGYHYIDKTRFVADFWNQHTPVLHLTRPTGWGRSLNLSMLEHFFAAEVGGIPTSGLFDGLEIATYQDGAYMAHQGKYLVLSLSFKSLIRPDYQTFLSAFRNYMASKFSEYYYLLDSNKLDTYHTAPFKKILAKEASRTDLLNSIYKLCECLSEHHNKQVMVFIDDCDTPMNYAVAKGYQEELLPFMRNILIKGLRSPRYIQCSLVMCLHKYGILSFEGILSSGLNALTQTLMNDRFSEYFGLTQKEVAALLDEYDFPVTYASLRQWYGGYQLTGQHIFNTAGVMQCLFLDGHISQTTLVHHEKAFLMKGISSRSRPQAFHKDLIYEFYLLLQGVQKEARVDSLANYHRLASTSTLWCTLIDLGFFRFKSTHPGQGFNEYYYLAIPNDSIKLKLIDFINTVYKTEPWKGIEQREKIPWDSFDSAIHLEEHMAKHMHEMPADKRKRAMYVRETLVGQLQQHSNDVTYRQILAPEIQGAAIYTAMYMLLQDKQSKGGISKAYQISQLLPLCNLIRVGDECIPLLMKGDQFSLSLKADTLKLPPELLPSKMRTVELLTLVLNYHTGYVQMKQVILEINKSLSRPSDKMLTLAKLDRYFTNPAHRQKNPKIWATFNAAREKHFTPPETALKTYCLRPDIYDAYLEQKYSKMRSPVSFRSFSGKYDQPSFIDLVARLLNGKFIISGLHASSSIYRTAHDSSGSAELTAIEYHGENKFSHKFGPFTEKVRKQEKMRAGGHRKVKSESETKKDLKRDRLGRVIDAAEVFSGPLQESVMDEGNEQTESVTDQAGEMEQPTPLKKGK